MDKKGFIQFTPAILLVVALIAAIIFGGTAFVVWVLSISVYRLIGAAILVLAVLGITGLAGGLKIPQSLAIVMLVIGTLLIFLPFLQYSLQPHSIISGGAGIQSIVLDIKPQIIPPSQTELKGTLDLISTGGKENQGKCGDIIYYYYIDDKFIGRNTFEIQSGWGQVGQSINIPLESVSAGTHNLVVKVLAHFGTTKILDGSYTGIKYYSQGKIYEQKYGGESCHYENIASVARVYPENYIFPIYPGGNDISALLPAEDVSEKLTSWTKYTLEEDFYIEQKVNGEQPATGGEEQPINGEVEQPDFNTKFWTIFNSIKSWFSSLFAGA